MAEFGVTPLTLGATRLFLNFNRPSGVVDVGYDVEWADQINAPNAWSRAGVSQQVISDDGVRRQIHVSVPKGSAGQRFVRLTVRSR